MTEVEPLHSEGGAGVGAMFAGSAGGVGISADGVGDGASEDADAGGF